MTTTDEQATGRSVDELIAVATFDGPMSTGVTVSRPGRIFANYPRWGDDMRFTVVKIAGG